MRKLLIIVFLLTSAQAMADEQCSKKDKLNVSKAEEGNKKDSKVSDEYKYHLEYIKRIDRSAASR